ncbi:DUF6703 family protein [Micromonospora sp. NBC_01813]|uniref:DUF6703 family protein n=1 Tax=Micromonospora sp. NBC_01813 TaxID=2975988 RepID=UPI002DDA7322|nr:DUF6703 family protein [Micromonospora sp. NBC_01813]WSA09343.1 hypothetical protein OG958_00445 [Micromonospora sp. NBC_01813]
MQPTQPSWPARLRRINPTGAFLAALALMLVGLFAPGVVGGAALFLLAGGLVMLLRLTWPAVPPAGRLLRLLVLTLLVAAALAKIF